MISVIAVPLNALRPIVSSPVFSDTLARFEHPENTYSPMVFRYRGHFISVISVQFLNALLAICVTLFPSMPSGISIDPVAPI